MKPARRSNPFLRSSLIGLAAVSITPFAMAATLYWDGVSGDWTLNTNWSSAVGATTPDPALAPVAADSVVFNNTGANSVASQTAYLNGSQSITAVTVNNTGNTTLSGGTSATPNSTDTLTASGSLAVGTTAGNRSKFTVSTNLTALNLAVGGNTTGSGAVYQNAGTLALTDTTAGTGAAAADRILSLGGSGSTGTPGYGYYQISGGSLTSKQINVGARATGATAVMDVTGGSVSVTNKINIARGNTLTTATHGALNVTGGSVSYGTVTATEPIETGYCAGGMNVLTVGGGASAASVTGGSSATGGLDLGNQAQTATGVANLLTNGILTVSRVIANNATPTSLLNFNGGTLQATPTNAGAAFLTNANLDAVTVYGAGGTIDNNGTNITIGKALTAASGNGVASIPVATTGAGYIGAPMVVISGGGGTGATARAVLSGDVVSSIVVTNPGTGYTSAPTVTLVGGGGSTAATIGAVTTSANTSGGMTFTGAGTTTITGTNTYSGATSINNGTVLLSGTGAFSGTSSLNVNGSLAKLVQTSSVTPPAVTLTQGTLDGTTAVGTVSVADQSNSIVSNGNGTAAAFTLGSLAFSGDAAIDVRTAGSAGIAVTGALSTTPVNGTVTINPTHTGIWSNGLTNLVSFGSFGGSIGNFTLGSVNGTLTSRQTVSGLVLNGNNIALSIIGDTPKWTGALDGQWTTTPQGNPKNWKLVTGGTVTDYLDTDVVLFDDSATGTTDLLIDDNDVMPADVVFSNATKNYSIGSNNGYGISGATNLSKSGAAALAIQSTNFFTGTVTFNGGTLVLNHSFALGTGASALTIGTGDAKTLDNTSGSAVTLLGNRVQTWNDDLSYTGSNDLDLGTGGVTLGGSGTDRTLTASAGTLVIGELKAAAHGFVKQGAGTLVLTSTGAGAAASQISGALHVAAGTLQINRSAADAANSGDFTATDLGGAGTITNGATAERWLFINTAGTSTFGGTLANGGTGGLGFNKQGAGSMALTGSNSHTGETTLAAGTLIAGSPTALGNTSIVRLTTGTTLVLASDSTEPYAYPISQGTTSNTTIVSDRATPGAGVVHALNTQTAANGIGGGSITFTSGANVTSGTAGISFAQFNLGAGSVQTTTLNPTGVALTIGSVKKSINTPAQTLALDGTTTGNEISGLIENGTSTAVSLTKSNSSTWTISGSNNTYTGNTVIGAANGAGVLRATASGALGTGTVIFDGSGGTPGPTSRLEISNNITLANHMSLAQRNNATPLVESVGGSNTLSGNLDLVAGGTQATIQSDAGLLTLSGGISTSTATSRSLNLAGAGDGQATGVISNGTGTVNLSKSGAGTWTLAGANTYTGTTTVNGGTLSLAQPYLADAAAVSIGGGAALNLTHGSTDTVDRLFLGGVEQAPGVWGALGSGAAHETSQITGSGKILATNGVSASAYDAWAALKGLTVGVNDGVTQDPENDGIENVLEFVLGGNPLASDLSILPAQSLDATNYHFTFNRSDESETEISLNFQYGSDLSGWTSVAIGAASAGQVTVTENGASPDAVEVIIPRSSAVNGKLFGRLKAVK